MHLTISKSNFIKHVKCEKSYYLSSKKIVIPKITPSQQLLFDSGREYEDYVYQMKMFKNNIHIQKECETAENRMNFSEMKILTNRCLENRDTVVLEATLSAEFNNHIQLFSMIDILKPNSDGSWNIYEIKSSKSQKPTHILDVAFQYFTAQKRGLNIKDVYIVHFNGEYVRKGNLDIDQLSSFTCVTSEVKKVVKSIPETIFEIATVSNLKDIPKKKVGVQCFEPYECLFKDYCWESLPKPNVFDFFGIKTASKYYAKGYSKLEDIPLGDFSSKELAKVKKYKKGKILFNKSEINAFLSDLVFPIYYFDFETYMPRVPAFDNSMPYQKIPFQYSIHKENNLNSEVIHFEFLAKGDGLDPREELLINLIKHLGDKGSVVVYHKSFEESVLRNLSKIYPKHQLAINSIIERLVDLKLIFSNQHAYHPKMRLSKSTIKIVLEAFTNHSYKDLKGVSNGGEAMDIFYLMQSGFYRNDQKKDFQLKQELLDYCELDTFGMLALVRTLRDKVI